MTTHDDPSLCSVRRPRASAHHRERGVRWTLALSSVMMLVEIVVGYATYSMALLADGWHMATHVAALGVAAIAYAMARRYASHAAFGFGTGKIMALAGFASAVALGLAAGVMAVESIGRLASPVVIDFRVSLPVAIVGLIVNLASLALLGHGEEHADDHAHHDHNHRAAWMHLAADTLTSALAIAALAVGWWVGIVWLDALAGIAGAIVIGIWAVSLLRTTGAELLDIDPDGRTHAEVRAALARLAGVSVVDLHVWSLGAGSRGCVVTIVVEEAASPEAYREAVLAACRLQHLTVEVRVRPPEGALYMRDEST